MALHTLTHTECAMVHEQNEDERTINKNRAPNTCKRLRKHAHFTCPQDDANGQHTLPVSTVSESIFGVGVYVPLAVYSFSLSLCFSFIFLAIIYRSFHFECWAKAEEPHFCTAHTHTHAHPSRFHCATDNSHWYSFEYSVCWRHSTRDGAFHTSSPIQWVWESLLIFIDHHLIEWSVFHISFFFYLSLIETIIGLQPVCAISVCISVFFSICKWS